MNQDEQDLIAKVISIVPSLPRTSWWPEVSKETNNSPDCDINNLKSSFGGSKPFRPDNFRWPRCQTCDGRKTLVCRINIEELPVLMQENIGKTSGLIQIFYCLTCGNEDPPEGPLFEDLTFIPKSKFILSLQSLAAVEISKHSLDKTELPTQLQKYVEDYTEDVPVSEYQPYYSTKVKLNKVIVDSWEAIDCLELPSGMDFFNLYEEELKQLGKLTDGEIEQFEDILDGIHFDGIHLPGFLKKLEVAVGGMGGYFRWLQDPEYPTCPDCHVDMKVTFLQIDDYELFEYDWGLGRAYVLLCPNCTRPALISQT